MCCSYFRVHNPQMCTGVQDTGTLPLFVLQSHADEKSFHHSSLMVPQEPTGARPKLVQHAGNRDSPNRSIDCFVLHSEAVIMYDVHCFLNI